MAVKYEATLGITRLYDWAVRYKDPEVAYGTKISEVVGAFTAIMGQVNCSVKESAREAVLVGFVYDYPPEDEVIKDGTRIITSEIVKIEHRFVPGKTGRSFPWRKDEPRFATFVTVVGGITYMLGDIGQRLTRSINQVNFDVMRAACKFNPRPNSVEEADQEKGFDDFAEFFCDININYQPLSLVGYKSYSGVAEANATDDIPDGADG